MLRIKVAAAHTQSHARMWSLRFACPAVSWMPWHAVAPCGFPLHFVWLSEAAPFMHTASSDLGMPPCNHAACPFAAQARVGHKVSFMTTGRLVHHLSFYGRMPRLIAVPLALLIRVTHASRSGLRRVVSSTSYTAAATAGAVRSTVLLTPRGSQHRLRMRRSGTGSGGVGGAGSIGGGGGGGGSLGSSPGVGGSLHTGHSALPQAVNPPAGLGQQSSQPGNQPSTGGGSGSPPLSGAGHGGPSGPSSGGVAGSAVALTSRPMPGHHHQGRVAPSAAGPLALPPVPSSAGGSSGGSGGAGSSGGSGSGGGGFGHGDGGGSTGVDGAMAPSGAGTSPAAP
jgi:hypothetical protein